MAVVIISSHFFLMVESNLRGSVITLLLLIVCCTSGHAQPDHPVLSTTPPIYLDGPDWVASSPTYRIRATVPGDIITDLERVNVTGDPYYELNWLDNSSLWHGVDWTYERNFTIPNSNQNNDMLLVFDGVKMGATIVINKRQIGTIQNQFLRYEFHIPRSSIHYESNNTLQVHFDDAIDTQGRFMACTGGWDWAPYSYTTKQESSTNNVTVNTFSKGIWKSVYLAQVPRESPIVIIDVTVHTHYRGPYPLDALVEHHHGGFRVNVTIHFRVPANTTVGIEGNLRVSGSWNTNSSQASIIPLPSGQSSTSIQLLVPAEDILLWWPTGMGEQPLYDVNIRWQRHKGESTFHHSPLEDETTIKTSRRVGFRVFALVTTNDTDVNSNTNASSEGSGKHGMMFRVNGVAMYSRGANIVPMEELEGRLSDAAHRQLVKSALHGGMNTIRVWGGGMYLPRSFYDACDEFGVLLYHDLMYANMPKAPHGPQATTLQELEIRHQIRRLSHHPSIVLWDGVNEVVVEPKGDTKIFATFVMSVVAQEDTSRAIWPSSPAAGWVTGVDTLYGISNGNSLTTHGGGHIWDQGIETHAPYQLGSGWPVVNGGSDDNCWDRWHLVHVPPILDSATKHGPSQRNVYASEFGVTGSPSFESLSAVLAKEHWGLHGGATADTCAGACQSERSCSGRNAMAQRNYACDAGIRLWMGTAPDLDVVGEEALKGQTYLCQLVQALDQKAVIEERRGQNQFGALVWMLNDIWPSISWGSLEYSSGKKKGHLLGGRWKPMHYFYRQSLFADVMATCGMQRHSSQWTCYVKNDRAGKEFQGVVTLRAYELMKSVEPATLLEHHVNLEPGPGAVEWFKPPAFPNPNTTVVLVTIREQNSSAIVSEHLLTQTYPKNLMFPKASVSFDISNSTNPDGTIDITVQSDRIALWVTLTSKANGYFTDNTFFLPACSRTIQFAPFFPSKRHHQILQQTLRIEDFSRYMPTGGQKRENFSQDNRIPW